MDEHGVLTIRAGYCWDGPSGPTVDSIGTMRASLIHDVLYQAIREGYLEKTRNNRRLSDKEYYLLLREGGIPAWRANTHYVGLRIGGSSSAGMKFLSLCMLGLLMSCADEKSEEPKLGNPTILSVEDVEREVILEYGEPTKQSSGFRHPNIEHSTLWWNLDQDSDWEIVIVIEKVGSNPAEITSEYHENLEYSG